MTENDKQAVAAAMHALLILSLFVAAFLVAGNTVA